MGEDCVSPSRHVEFSSADEMLDWVEMLAAETGLPVGIKSAVGDLAFWHELTELMAQTGRAIDFVTIDGGEGGTAHRRRRRRAATGFGSLLRTERCTSELDWSTPSLRLCGPIVASTV